jgi:UDP-N-acetylglucosamine 2-epimerase (non-hydrolysing)
MNILSIIGTRADIIKMSLLISILNKSEKLQHKVLFTNQHKEMGLNKINEFNIEVDFTIANNKSTSSNLILFLILEIKNIINNYRPDIIIVHGDTLTAISGAIAAHECNIKICHVEAGLRSNNIYAPYPEEINRTLISRIAYHHYCPTKISYNNLINEGIHEKNVFLTGNTIVDIVRNSKLTKNKLNNKFNILVTTHRRESWGVIPKIMCNIINIILKKNSKVFFTILSHPNNEIYSVYKENLLQSDRISLSRDRSYSDTLNLIYNSSLVATDSCGIQEESSILGKPTIILRNETERPESINNNCAELSTIKEQEIYTKLSYAIENKKYLKKMSNPIKSFGDGMSSLRIKEIINNIANMENYK